MTETLFETVAGNGIPRHTKTRHGIVERREVLPVTSLSKPGGLRGSWVTLRGLDLSMLGLSHIRASRFRVELHRASGGDSDAFAIDWTRCHFGGHRPWFVCPCGKRTAKLYKTGRFFGCRSCGNLVYECQLQSAKGRARLKAFKLKSKLGDCTAPTGLVPDRPRGMRRRTYVRLALRLSEAESRASSRRRQHAHH